MDTMKLAEALMVMSMMEKDMSVWRPIETAPVDGTEVITAKKSDWVKAYDHFSYPITSRFEDGLWKAKFSNGWQRYEPQPTHWMPK